MLPNHTPLTVAEQFHTLVAIHGDRIDLGLGRAGGADQRTLAALGRRPEAHTDDGFTADVVELTGFLSGNWPAGHPSREIRVSPAGPPPPVFLLGSSVSSARRAGHLGLPFAYARHLAPAATAAAAAEYRAAFARSGHPGAGRLIVATGVICAGTPEAAEQAAIRSGLIRLRAAQARADRRMPATAESLDPQCSPAERLEVLRRYAASEFLIGDAERVSADLGRLVEQTGADEVMLLSPEFEARDRIRTLGVVAGGLAGTTVMAA
jgi:luciferase family oxidoreductase group 1